MKAIWKNQTLRNGFFLGLAHLLLTMILVLYSFSEVMARWDEGSSPTVFENFIGICAETLMQPLYAVYSAMPKEIKSTILDWSLLAANSLLWGFGVLFLWRRVRHFKNKH